jgi:DNA-directed RNA polymerase specialized sigma24 family protein
VIAEILGCREATVRTSIHRALAKLRKEIES